MATHAATRNISGLARAMVQHGLLSEYDADALHTQAQTANVGFVEQVLLSKRMTASQVAGLVRRRRSEAEITVLDGPALWGGPIDDERFVVVSRR